MNNDHSRLVIARKNKINSFEQEEFSSVKSEKGLFLYISLRLIQNYSSLVYNDLSLNFLMIPFVMGFFSFIFLPLLSSQPFTCKSNYYLLDTCPISTFLESLGVAIRLKITVQVSLPH